MILRGLALERDSHATDVVERVTAVQAEEMAVIAFAEPVTELRHYHPVFDFLVLVLIQRPRVVGAREVEGRAFAQPKLGVVLDQYNRLVFTAISCALTVPVHQQTARKTPKINFFIFSLFLLSHSGRKTGTSTPKPILLSEREVVAYNIDDKWLKNRLCSVRATGNA